MVKSERIRARAKEDMTCNIGTKLYRDWCFKHHKNVLNAFKTAKKNQLKKTAYYRNANENNTRNASTVVRHTKSLPRYCICKYYKWE